MGHACVGFEAEDIVDVLEHWRGQLEVIEEYGGECGNHRLHEGDFGFRALLKCKTCGGYILLQHSEYREQKDARTCKMLFPVTGPEEAAKLNAEQYGRWLAREIGKRYVIWFEGEFPHWSQFRKMSDFLSHEELGVHDEVARELDGLTAASRESCKGIDGGESINGGEYPESFGSAREYEPPADSLEIMRERRYQARMAANVVYASPNRPRRRKWRRK